MKRYIDREALLKDIEESVVFSGRAGHISPEMRGANKITDRIKSAPAADVVHIDEVFRLIAGHSNYHGDDILSALMCVAEGKEVKPIKPLTDVAKVKHGKWSRGAEPSGSVYAHCSACNRKMNSYCYGYAHCPLCGARMDGE